MKVPSAGTPRGAGAAFKNIALLAVVLLFCAGSFEVAVRLLVDDGMSFELEMWKYARDVKVRDLAPDVGHRHGANRNAVLMGVDVRTDGRGFRGSSIPEQATQSVARIAFVGDSTTMGWGVAERETFADRVVADLAKRGRKVDGFNQGVGNWNTRQELAVFRDSGMRMKPDIVVLTYFINDAEPTPTYAQQSWLDLNSAAWIVLNYRLDSVIRLFGPRPDWKQYYRGLYDDNVAGWQQTQKAIAGFAEASRSLGVPLVVFHLPELRELKPYPFSDVTAKVRRAVEAQGLPFVDLLPTVENLAPASLWVTVPDPHPNGRANEAFAGRMVEVLLPLLDSLCSSRAKGCTASK